MADEMLDLSGKAPLIYKSLKGSKDMGLRDTLAGLFLSSAREYSISSTISQFKEMVDVSEFEYTEVEVAKYLIERIGTSPPKREKARLAMRFLFGEFYPDRNALPYKDPLLLITMFCAALKGLTMLCTFVIKNA